MTGSGNSINQVKSFITRRMGWSLSRFNDQELYSRIESIGQELGFGNFNEFTTHLLSNQMTDRELQAIANRFTIGESFFFRYRSDFQTVNEQVIPSIIKTKLRGEPIQVWCAGCSSGEEPYTAAIYIHKKYPHLNQDQLKIFGTDINTLALKKAREALYTPWSLRDTTDPEKRLYFIQQRNRWLLSQQIKSCVSYSYLNLAENQFFVEKAPSQKFDIIFCRNVLIYFSPEKTTHVLNNFAKMLTPNGVLIVSPCESSLVPTSLYSHEIIHSTTLLRPQRKTKSIPVRNSRKTTTAYSQIRNHDHQIIENKTKKQKLIPRGSSRTTRSINYFKKAQSLYTDGAYESAAGMLLMLIRSANYRYQADHYQLLIKSLVNDKKPDEALEWVDNALKLDKLSSDLRYTKASILQELNQFDEARHTYLDILFLEPDAIGANFFLAGLEKQQGNILTSQRLYKKALIALENQNADELADGMDGLTVGEAIKINKGLING